MSTAGKLCFRGKTLASKVICGPSDVLLMLDSSWEYHESQKLVFREARLRGTEVITTIYDLVPIKGSAFCDPGIPRIFSDWLRTALTFSTGVVCISRAVANEFIQLLRAIHFPRVMKIGYWHLGADFTCSSFAVSGAKFKTSSPQFLMVGTIEPRKGHAVALDAFDALWAQGFQGSLILIGKRGWNMEHFISRIRSHPELGTRLHWIEGASDEELPRLYASCSALIAASYAEGFGLPIVEAAKYGKPIIASDIPVFREVTGESQVAAFFEVGSSEALADRIKTFSVQSDQSPIFENKQTRWITWGESAQQLADAVIGGNWYHTYQPTRGQVAQVGLGIGDVVMRRPLTKLERLHKLELVEGPLLASGGKTLRIVVRLWNLSNVSWAGSGEDDAKFAVQLGYHVLREDGSTLQCDSPMTQIPFVVGPDDGLYLAVEVASNWLDRGARFVDIEMQQEGVGWWGMPLRVLL
jgi:glycosyltransferase involved in cell wall biosynthesis